MTSKRLALLGLLLIAGCAEKSTVPERPVSTPSVFGASTTDTQRYYYGMGEGKSVTDARNAALADIAARISVTVGSHSQSVTSFRQRGEKELLESELRTDIKAETTAIDFVGVKDVSSERIDGRWRVGVSVDREQLAQKYAGKTEQAFREIAGDFALYMNEPLFPRLKRAEAIEKRIQLLEEDMALLEAIRPGMDVTKYRNAVAEMRQSFSSLPAGTRFVVRGDADSSSLVTLLKDALGREGYGVAQERGNITVIVQTGYEIKRYKSTNEKMANMIFLLRTAYFKVLNADGSLASEHAVTTRSASPEGVEAALRQTKQYEALIEEEGIIAFIGGSR